VSADSGLSQHAQNNIIKILINQDIRRLDEVILEFNFKKAIAKSKWLVRGILGQFSRYKVFEHRKEYVIDEVEKLNDIFRNRGYQSLKGLIDDEKALLSMYLGQEFENL